MHNLHFSHHFSEVYTRPDPRLHGTLIVAFLSPRSADALISINMSLVEVVPNSSSTSAPGWAYVPDNGFDPSKAPIQPAARKRNARTAGLTGGDTTAKQNNALLKRLADLNKDNAKDGQISVTTKGKERSKGKTPATRKILMSNKTFDMYLAGEEALAALEPPPGPRSKVALQKAAQTKSEQASKTSVHNTPAPTAQQPFESQISPSPSPTGIDDSKLVQTRTYSEPSAELMEILVSAPPLSFHDVRAPQSSSKVPARRFCELCGYWGSIKCIQCGAKLCGLDCKRAHDEDRCQKYTV